MTTSYFAKGEVVATIEYPDGEDAAVTNVGDGYEEIAVDKHEAAVAATETARGKAFAQAAKRSEARRTVLAKLAESAGLSDEEVAVLTGRPKPARPDMNPTRREAEAT